LGVDVPVAAQHATEGRPSSSKTFPPSSGPLDRSAQGSRCSAHCWLAIDQSCEQGGLEGAHGAPSATAANRSIIEAVPKASIRHLSRRVPPTWSLPKRRSGIAPHTTWRA